MIATRTDSGYDLGMTRGATGPTMYVKQGSAWVAVTKAYRKVSGSWQQVALDSAFDSTTRYVRA